MNPSTAMARAVLGELVHQGVRELVLAPGSRSAPLAFEALRLERAGLVRLHVRVDERSAGFLALGLAKMSGGPVAVICTSGTAVANLTPAVVEASYSAVPLVVVTADRPPEARGVGAPQTIDQRAFFGRLVRSFAEVGAPRHADPADPGGPELAARAAVGIAVAASLGTASGVGASGSGASGSGVSGSGVSGIGVSGIGVSGIGVSGIGVSGSGVSGSGVSGIGVSGSGVSGIGVRGAGASLLGSAHAGPVHLNVAFRLPLVPDLDADPTDAPASPWDRPDVAPALLAPTSARAEASGVHHPPRVRRPAPPVDDHPDLAEVLDSVPARGVLLVGDLPPSSALDHHHRQLVELAVACGWPIVAEPTANLHDAPTWIAHAPLVLGSVAFLNAHEPDLVLSAGLFGLSRPTLELLRRAHRHVALDLADVGREVCDPIRTAHSVLGGVPRPPARPEVDPAWLADWQTAVRAAADETAQLLESRPTTTAARAAADETAQLLESRPTTTAVRAAADETAQLLESRPTTTAARAAADETGRLIDHRHFTAAQAVERLWRLAPADGLLLVAASWPVRQLEAFGGSRTGVRVVGNRGANGIDGLVSTAWGAALAHQSVGGGPGLALLGDLAFLHDHNGLLAGTDEPRPDLVLVVLDNDGGGVFHQLEQGQPEYAGDFERLFGTPLGRDLVAVASAAGVPAVRVHDADELATQVTTGMSAGGVRVVVAHVPDRRAEADLFAQARAAVARRLGPAQA